MKRVNLKELHAPYTLALQEEMLHREPFILERNGEPLAAVIPIKDYQAFLAWQKTQGREQKRGKDQEAFERERQAFERLKPDLLHSYRGQWVAIYRGEVVETGQDRSRVLDRVYSCLGYVPVYVDQVTEVSRIYQVPHRKVVG